MTLYDSYIALVDTLILAGVWYEIYLMQRAKRRAQIKKLVTRTLHRVGLT